MKFFVSLSAAVLLAAGCRVGTSDYCAGSLCEPLNDSAWAVSEWISASDAPVVTGKVTSEKNCRAADGASWFVSEVKNPEKVVSAKWMTAGLGVYELYVNGTRIGEEFLKPGFTHSLKTKYSFTYDVTDAIRTGKGSENVFSACSTPGWWADKIVTPGNRPDGMLGKKPAFRGVLELTFADGTKTLFGTGTENWKAGVAGPVLHAAIFDGQEYDARVLPGFETPELLSTPELNTEFSGEILPTAGAEVYLRRDLALAPVEAYVWKEVEGACEGQYGKVVKLREYAPGKAMTLLPGETLVVDFAQNASAVPSFVFKAPEGTVLTCLPSEILNDGNGAKSRGMDGPEGSCHRENLRIPDEGMRLVYTFAGKGWESFLPRRTFFGYRYVSITATGKVVIKSLESVPVTSIAAGLETGKITTGNDLVNRLISNTVWGQRSNYLSVPTDCPQRNERLGWTADTQVFTETGAFFANTDRFFHKWMRDMRDSQDEVGGFPGVAPTSQYGEETMRLGWADAGIIVPWTVWRQFGDVSIIDENWDAMVRFLDRIEQSKYSVEANKAQNGNYHWADWLSYEPLESHSWKAFIGGKHANGPMPETLAYWNYLSACYWVIDASMMADMAKASGRDAARFEESAATARDYIRSSFLRPDGSFKVEVLNTMQTPALFALKAGIVEGEAKDATVERLRENFAAHGGCLQTGFLGTSILMETLTANGMADIAYDVLFQEKDPSWLYAVLNGATTIWERWNSYTYEKGMGPKGMNSFNHYAYGCVCQWIWERAAGICADASAPGFRHIVMSPVFDKRLGWLDAEYESAAGTVRSSWKYEGDALTWTFSIPEGCVASVTLPGSCETKDYESGTYTLNL